MTVAMYVHSVHLSSNFQRQSAATQGGIGLIAPFASPVPANQGDPAFTLCQHKLAAPPNEHTP